MNANEKVKTQDGKEFDYHEISNLNQKDIVDVFRKCDELHKICQEKKIPIYIGFVPSEKKFLYFSASYDSSWDDKDFRKISILAGGTMIHFKNTFGICYKFDKIDFNEREVNKK